MARNRVARKFYVTKDGERVTRGVAEWSAIGFEFFDPDQTKDKDGNVIVASVAQFARDKFPAHILDIATGHGLMQKIGDEFAGKGEEAAEIAQTMFERLTGDGEWNTERGAGSGPRPSMVSAALARALVELGESEETATAKATAATDSAEKRKAVLTNSKVASHYAAIQLENAQAKAKAAAKAAKESGAEGSDELLTSLLNA